MYNCDKPQTQPTSDQTTCDTDLSWVRLRDKVGGDWSSAAELGLWLDATREARVIQIPGRSPAITEQRSAWEHAGAFVGVGG